MKINFGSDFYYVLLIFLGISILLYVLMVIRNKLKPGQASPIDLKAYQLKVSVLTKNELAFYKTLEEVVQAKLTILAMVRLADIFYVPRQKGNQAALNRINSRHVDFLLCQKDTLRPVIAIELDDKSHERADRIMRDDFVNQLFESTGLPLLRYPSKYRYSPNDIRSELEPVISKLDNE